MAWTQLFSGLESLVGVVKELKTNTDNLGQKIKEQKYKQTLDNYNPENLDG